MTDDARTALRRRLGDDVRALDELPDEAVTALKAAFDDARRRQGRALTAASEEALGHLPLLLRGAVRKVLGV